MALGNIKVVLIDRSSIHRTMRCDGLLGN